jgi:hypothetical protein
VAGEACVCMNVYVYRTRGAQARAFGCPSMSSRLGDARLVVGALLGSPPKLRHRLSHSVLTTLPRRRLASHTTHTRGCMRNRLRWRAVTCHNSTAPAIRGNRAVPLPARIVRHGGSAGQHTRSSGTPCHFSAMLICSIGYKRLISATRCWGKSDASNDEKDDA